MISKHKAPSLQTDLTPEQIENRHASETKTADLLITLLFAGILFFFAVLIYLLPQREYSEQENRPHRAVALFGNVYRMEPFSIVFFPENSRVKSIHFMRINSPFVIFLSAYAGLPKLP